MARGLLALSRQGGRRWWSVVVCAVLSLGAGVQASVAKAETRDFAVYVDGRKSGEVHMTFDRQDDGTTAVSCDTDVRVGAIITLYHYSYHGREFWKDGRLQRFESKANDDGKEMAVTAAAADDGLRVRNNDGEHTASADAWPTSYWAQPDPKLADQTIPLLDADTGHDLEAKVQFLGLEKFGPDGQQQTVQHVGLTGKGVGMDLWYDESGRLVRQEWVEQGHRTVIDLTRVRR